MCFKKKVPALPPPSAPADFELPSPGYWLKPPVLERLTVSKDDLPVLLEADPVVWKTTVADTNSMDTMLDYRHTVVLIQGANERDHQRILDWIIPGDIVAYEPPDGGLYMHAVRKITIDAQRGRIWTTHALNPLVTWDDPFETPDSKVKWVCVAVLYTDNP